MTIAERDRLTAMVLIAMRHGMGQRDYPGGTVKLLSDFLFAWGVPATPENIRNRTCGLPHSIGELSLFSPDRKS